MTLAEAATNYRLAKDAYEKVKAELAAVQNQEDALIRLKNEIWQEVVKAENDLLASA